MGTDTEEELNMDNEEESSHSSNGCSKSMISHNMEENKQQDEEEQEFVDIFTDILGLIVLNKKQKEAEEEVAAQAAIEGEQQCEIDRLKDSQMVPLMQRPNLKNTKQDKQIVEEASSMCESEMP